MFHRIQQYPLIGGNERWYRPRAYGDPQPDGTWDGWLVFFPLAGGRAIAPPAPATTQRTAGALSVWAAGLGPVYLEGALARAIAVEEEPLVIGQLEAAEYEALEDAVRLEKAAAVKRDAAALDDALATVALEDGDRLRRERIVTEEAVARPRSSRAAVIPRSRSDAGQRAGSHGGKKR